MENAKKGFKPTTLMKKSLATLMAFVMVMSCWVFAPEMFSLTAEAAAGSYYVTVWVRIYDDSNNNYNNNYESQVNANGVLTNSNSKDNCAGFTVYYKPNNGTGTETWVAKDIGKQHNNNHGDRGTMPGKNDSSFTWSDDNKDYLDKYTSEDKKNNSYCLREYTFTLSGFPTKVYWANDNAGFTDETEWCISGITVASSSLATPTYLWKGIAGGCSTMERKEGTILPSRSGYQADTTNDKKNCAMYTYYNNWVYPYAKTISVTKDSSSTVPVTAPKTLSDSAKTVKVNASATDQYGVQMFDPTWSGTCTVNTNGISLSTTSSSASTTAQITSAANLAGTTDSQSCTVTATWSTPNSTGNTSKTGTYTFTINDAYYDYTFTGHKNSDGVLQTNATGSLQYGHTPTAPTASNYQSGDYDWTFSAWSPTVGQLTADTTYTATYNSAFVEADYSGVTAAIAAVNTMETSPTEHYSERYTADSRAAVKQAINLVTYGLGRTHQDDVDNYAAAINAAREALKVNSFGVVFLNDDGTLIDSQVVEYGQTATKPANPTKAYDAYGHYDFLNWDTADSDLQNVTRDLIVKANYKRWDHTYTEETLPSSCVQEGCKKYTCSCGYSYISDSTGLGSHTWETEYTTDIPATCTTDGWESIHCALCDAQKDGRKIDATGHAYGEETVIATESCNGTGAKQKTCATCGHVELTTISALGHNMVDEPSLKVNATCFSNGYSVKQCTRCGRTERYDIKTGGHAWSDWSTISEPTCLTTGLKGRTCSNCSLMETNVILATGHSYKTEWTTDTEPTCVEYGSKSHHCLNCDDRKDITNIDPLGHTCDEEGYTPVHHAATCREAGYNEFVCARCDYTRTVAISSEPALGHDWDSGVDVEGNAATCTEGGSKLYTCQREGCGVTTTMSVEALGHDYAVDEEVKPTCTTGGHTTYKCSRCGDTYTDNFDATGHSILDGVYHNKTCTTGAYTVYVCGNEGCDYSYKVYDEANPATGHNWGEWVVDPEPTAIETGLMQRTCQNEGCGAVETIELPAGHDYDVDGEPIIIENDPSTCTHAGHVTYMCKTHAVEIDGEWVSTCNIDLTENLSILEHNLKTTVTPATCVDTGLTETKCADCEYEETPVVIPAYGHAYNDGEYADEADKPTCVTDGTLTYTCTRAFCTETTTGHTKTETVPATGHDYEYDNGVVTPAKCTEDGKVVYTCKNCAEGTEGHTTEETLPLLGHDWVADLSESALAAYVEANGESEYITYIEANCMHSAHWDLKCQREGCGQVIQIDDSSMTSTGHKWIVDEGTDADGWKITSAPTCTDEGTKERTCEYGCGTTETATATALGHDYEACTDANYTEATCMNGGYWTCECSRCDAVNEIRDEANPATGHVWVVEEGTDADGWKITTAPTCTEDGEKERTCKYGCGTTETAVATALGHDYEPCTDANYTAATCMNGGYWTCECSRCDAVNEIRDEAKPSTGHVWIVDEDTDADGWKTTTEPTCTENGEKERTCIYNCNTTETAVVEALGHDYSVSLSKTAPTCITDGSETLKCSRCTAQTTVTLGATGVHVFDAGTEHAATCIAYGYTTYKCIADPNCTYSYNVTHEDQEPLGHNFEEKWTLDVHPTCTENGSQSRHCTRCDEVTDVVVIGKTEHNLTNWEVVLESTCTERGIMVRRCTNTNIDPVTHALVPCGYTETDSVSFLPHQWQKVYTQDLEPTCTREGSKSVHCGVCGSIKPGSSVAVERLPHNYDMDHVTSTGADPKGAYTWKAFKCVTCTNYVVRPTFYAVAPNGKKIEGAAITITTYPGGKIIAQGETDANGVFAPNIVLEPKVNPSDVNSGSYFVDIKYPLKNYVATGIITVSDGVITGDIGVDGKLVNGPCVCSCHNDNFIAKLKRLIYSVISLVFKRTVKCCPDMEWHPSFAGKLK